MAAVAGMTVMEIMTFVVVLELLPGSQCDGPRYWHKWRQ